MNDPFRTRPTDDDFFAPFKWVALAMIGMMALFIGGAIAIAFIIFG